MTKIDLKPFLANASEYRKYLQSPMRSKHGAVACNGHIMICIDDDGDYTAAPDGLEKLFDNLADIEMASPVSLVTITLPIAVPCCVCDGDGYIYREECEECDGEGEFEHGSHTYECKECDGDGFSQSTRAFEGSNQVPYRKCEGRKEQFREFPVGDSQYSIPYLRLLQALPNCQIQPNGLMTAKFTFDGGWGVLMPMSNKL